MIHIAFYIAHVIGSVLMVCFWVTVLTPLFSSDYAQETGDEDDDEEEIIPPPP